MAELIKLDERLISGKGVLKVPAGAFQDRYYILYLDVIRRPKNEYLSFEWNPPRSVYARLVFRKDGYVQSEDIVRYQREERTYVNDITGQNLRAIKCAYEGILISFDRQNAALGLIPLPYDNLILDYKSLSLGWDEILFQCYADTAIQCRFYSLDYDTCNPANDQTDLPPPPPPPLPPVPPGTPIASISPPYDEDSSDDDNTQPFPGDDFEPPFPPLPDNTLIRWNVSTNLNPRTTYAQAVFTTFTPIGNYAVTGGNEDPGLNAKEWLTTFTSGTTVVNGSAVGTLTPEDKPLLYLWQDGVTDSPWQVISP